MPQPSRRRDIPCAICGPGAPFRVRYNERIDNVSVDFRARKTPTRQHFRVVECEGCGLVYSSPIMAPEVILRLYRDSPFIREDQIANMIRDYREQVRQVLPLVPGKKRLLEIGCADGAFLKTALELGFEEVHGVEPGKEAVSRAAASIRGRILNTTFSASLFRPESFDIVCCFQVLDHLLDPAAMVRAARQLLRPDGLLLLLNHDVRSWFPRLLGERCPMYDIEHIYLFDKRTVARLLADNGFDVIARRNVSNSYTLSYAAKMFPLPRPMKRLALTLLEKTGLAARCIRLLAGNMVALGRKRTPPISVQPL
jgi:SAM-dependent methyltransferase